MTDELLRAITADGLYRVAVASTTDVVAEAVRRHAATPVVARALARAITSGALLGVSEKEYHRIGVQWTGRGPMRSLHVDVRPGGLLRGYPGEADATAPSVAAALGPGLVHVVEQDEQGRHTQGSLPLSTSEVDEDIETWLRRSEQVPSRLRVLVDLDGEGMPAAVSGVLIQTLPGGAASALLGDEGGVSPELVARTLPASLDVGDLARRVLPGAPITELTREPLRFVCQCSAERVARGVAMLGAEEIDQMIGAGEETDVRCDFCNEHYLVDADGLRAIRATMDAG